MANAFITGVSSGIGEALARELIDRGWNVLGLSRRAPESLASSDRLEWQSVDLGALESISADVAPLLDVEAIELIVLNAGQLGEIRDLRETPLADLKRLMDVNLWANKILLEEIFRRPIAVRQVVAISSGAAVNGHRGWGGYALSKAALNMLVQLYAAECPATHFTALAPGLVDTAMQEYLCSLPSREGYPSIERLKEARGTEQMPTPGEAARHLVEVFPTLLDRPSGTFVDIRTGVR